MMTKLTDWATEGIRTGAIDALEEALEAEYFALWKIGTEDTDREARQKYTGATELIQHLRNLAAEG